MGVSLGKRNGGPAAFDLCASKSQLIAYANQLRVTALTGKGKGAWPAITMPRHSVARRRFVCLEIAIISGGIWRFE
jgi:uncharacterized membrane protein YsdA (DUF1294 family)